MRKVRDVNFVINPENVDSVHVIALENIQMQNSCVQQKAYVNACFNFITTCLSENFQTPF